MDGPFISICIPAYKNISYLQRLLDSIAIQLYTDFEVIITDDSPDDTVRDFVLGYGKIKFLNYSRNNPALGTPENWNEGIRRARGKWIEIMHDDDWFASPDSLTHFAKAAVGHPDSFLFSAYTDHFIETNRTKIVFPSRPRIKWMLQEPYTLLSKNIVGPPSVTMHRNDGKDFYDNKTKWVVDIDFYIRRIKRENVHYINKPLISVGMCSQQVTVDCVNNRKIQVPENFYLLQKVGAEKLNNVLVYDAWWRMIRNLEITNEEEIRVAGYNGVIPAPLKKMISSQKNTSRKLLTNGIYSKSRMMLHYLSNRK